MNLVVSTRCCIHALLFSLAVAPIGCGPAVSDFESGTGDQVSAGKTCRDGDRRLADDRCQSCTCVGGTWNCPVSEGTCAVQCTDGEILPGPGNCGWCTCIADTWVCDGEDDCECAYVAADASQCGEVVCSEFGTLDEVPCGTSGTTPYDEREPGLDPFAVSELVWCGERVPLLDRYGEGEERVVEASLDGTALTLAIEHEGGCLEHRFGLCIGRNGYGDGSLGFAGLFEDEVRTILVQVAHDRGDDLCEQRVTVSKTFDISAAVELYTERMDTYGLERGDRMLVDVSSFGPIPYIFDE